MPNNCFTMYIFHTDVLTYLPIQQPQASAYLHRAKIKTFRHVTLTHAVDCLRKFHQSRNFLHSLCCSCNSHTNHCSEQTESNPLYLSTLLLNDPFLILYSQICLVLPSTYKLKCRWLSFDCKNQTMRTNLLMILWVLKHREVYC